jgi:carbon storage regulator
VALNGPRQVISLETLPVLLLSRKPGQSIVINDDIVITIVAVDRNRVQVGIKAPGYVPVYRQEIVERMVEAGEIEPLACLNRAEPAAV